MKAAVATNQPRLTNFSSTPKSPHHVPKDKSEVPVGR